MTIGKKLYVNFGIILTMVVVLFLVNTVAELQIFYLQKDAASWVKNSTEALDVADVENRKLVEARRKSDETAGTATIFVALFSTLLAVGLGVVIAYRSAKSITDPLTNL